MSVLVIDDDPGVLQTLRRLLQRAKYDVLSVRSGREALSEVKQSTVELILLDLRFPDIDGVETLRQLNHACVPTPVIIITAYGTVASAVEAMKLGASHYLEKPFSRRQLLMSVDSALAHRDTSRTLQQSPRTVATPP